MKFKLLMALAGILFVVSACNAPASSSTSSTESAPAQQADTNIPATDIPVPAQINAPLVDGPAIVSIQFLNAVDGWAVTETQIIRTNDGGVTWYNVTPPNVTETGYATSVFPFDNSHVWIQKPDFDNYPNSGFLYRTSDGGLTWTNLTTPFSEGKIQFLDVNNGWALANLGVGAGSNAVAIYQTTDGGSTWTQKYINDPNNQNAGDTLPLGGLKSGIAPINMQTAWIYGVTYSTGSVYLFRTDDGGANWSLVTLPLPPGAENYELGIEPDHMKFVSPKDGFISVRFSGDVSQVAVYTTHDGGATWTLTPTLIPDGGSADFLSASEAVIYNGNQFYVTKDAARTWSIIPPDVKFGEIFAGLDFADLNTGWVVTLDSNDHRSLYRTSDGGMTWSPVVP
ncbi:MAG: hypothetical protein IPP66_20240 [Anaerolineales bacterium]|nr:hypothetical protein [Anaerolineales bacterium]